MRILAFLAAALLLVQCQREPSPGGATAGGPVVEVSEGMVRGERLPSGIIAYRGLPYARAPIGTLRWRPPEPPGIWTGVRDATRFAPSCPQPGETTEYYRRVARRLGRDTARVPEVPGRMSEDCLYLNVWTAALAPRPGASPRPVFVWVHGGSGTSGSGADPLFNGAALARHGIVVVTINYRLGALGFLAHPVLSEEDPDGVSGNYALQDILQALRWIRDNARVFGGDSTRVTMAGQSAGATLVETLMAVPEATGLFQRAILESATWLDPLPLRSTAGAASAESDGVRFVERIGVSGAVDASTLRSIPAGALIDSLARSRDGVPSVPVVEGRLLPEAPRRRWRAQHTSPVPLLMGSNDDEFSLLMPPTPLDPDAYRLWVRRRYGTIADEVLRARPPGADAEATRRQRVRLLSDEAFRAPELALVRWIAGRMPVWLYRFSWRPDDRAVGAFHGVELPFVFDTHVAAGWWARGPAVARLTETIEAAWIRFAETGDPNGGTLPPWPAATAIDLSTMVFDVSPRVQSLPGASMVNVLADRLEGDRSPR